MVYMSNLEVLRPLSCSFWQNKAFSNNFDVLKELFLSTLTCWGVFWNNFDVLKPILACWDFFGQIWSIEAFFGTNFTNWGLFDQVRGLIAFFWAEFDFWPIQNSLVAKTVQNVQNYVNLSKYFNSTLKLGALNSLWLI